jgi:phosphoserine phosphatase
MDRVSSSTGDQAVVPLCVDLDGTLVRSDTLWETILQIVKRRPAALPGVVLAYLRNGRSGFKSAATDAVIIEAAALPYHDDVLAEIRRARAAGRPVLLVTGANERIANAVADYVGLFDGVIGSRPGSNNTGHEKAAELSRRFGLRQYDYFGNSHADLKVWAQSHAALVIGSDSLTEKAAALAPVTFHAPAATVRRSHALFQALRPSAWVLNAVVFVPAIGTGHIGRQTVTAFIGLCGLSTAFRIFAELTALPAIRAQTDSARYPFAAGNLPLSWGVALASSLLVFAVSIAVAGLPSQVLAILAGFAAVSLLRVALAPLRPVANAVFVVAIVGLCLAAGYETAGEGSIGPSPAITPPELADQISWRY